MTAILSGLTATAGFTAGLAIGGVAATGCYLLQQRRSAGDKGQQR